MGFLNKITGGADKGVMKNGVLGRGLIVRMAAGGSTVQMGGGMVERVCDFEIEVTLDNVAPYRASCRQRVPEVYIPQLQNQGVVIAVRVDAQDPSKVALDLHTDPPTVTMASNPNVPTAADILATGTPAKGVIVESAALGKKNAAGLDMYAFLLSVMPPDSAPYQTKVGVPTPAGAIALIFPGAHVPVKIGSNPNLVAIDWDEALANPDI